jgi:hypothetical protein
MTRSIATKKQLPMLSPVMGLLRASWGLLRVLAGMFIANRDCSLRVSRSVFQRGAVVMLSGPKLLPTE